MKPDSFRFYDHKPDPELQKMQADINAINARITQIEDLTIVKFITKIDGRPPDPADSHLGQRVSLTHSDWADGFTDFFIWRKHHVLAWKVSPTGKSLVVFKHLYPDDYPEPVAKFIAELNPDGSAS